MASNSKKTVSVDTGAAKSSYRMSTLLSNKFNTFLPKNKPVSSNGERSLLKNLPNQIILNICVFNNFTLIGKSFTNIYNLLMN